MKKANTVAFVASLLLSACVKKPCICTTDLRVNYCLTFNGKKEIPDSLRIVRVHGDRYDTLQPRDAFGSCLPEKPGDSKIRMYKGDSLIRETPMIHVRTVDCCHGEPKTVDIALP